MLPYYIVFFLSVLLLLPLQKAELSSKIFEYRKQKLYINTKTLYYYGTSLPIILLSALRYGIGTDYFFAYKPVFEHLRYNHSADVELLYLLLNKIVLAFTDNFQVVIAVTSIIFVLLIYKIILRSKNRIENIILFLFTQTYIYSFNNIRQAISVSIVLAAIYSTEDLYSKKGFLKFAIGQVIALGFHMSSFVYTFIYFGYFLIKKFDLKRNIIMSIPIVIFALRSMFASKVFLRFMSLFNSGKYVKYFDSSFNQNVSLYARVEILVDILIYLIMIFAYLNTKWDRENDQDEIGFLIELIITSIAIIAPFITLSHRILRLFTPAQIMYLPSLAKKISKRYGVNYYLILLAISVLVFILFYFEICIYNYEECNPYVSIFS